MKFPNKMITAATIIACAGIGRAQASEAFIGQAKVQEALAILGQVSQAKLLASPLALAATRFVVETAPTVTGTNNASILQMGSHNNALIQQTGSGNNGVLIQQGRNNIALISQTNRTR